MVVQEVRDEEGGLQDAVQVLQPAGAFRLVIGGRMYCVRVRVMSRMVSSDCFVLCVCMRMSQMSREVGRCCNQRVPSAL